MSVTQTIRRQRFRAPPQALALRHDTLAANTRAQLKQVFEAIRELMSPLEPKRRPIGFITPEEKKRG